MRYKLTHNAKYSSPRSSANSTTQLNIISDYLMTYQIRIRKYKDTKSSSGNGKLVLDTRADDKEHNYQSQEINTNILIQMSLSIRG
jgi:hypothetical protein